MNRLQARVLLLAVAAAAATLLAAAPASAFLIQEKGGPQSASNGLALGPDGNFWVAEQFSDTLVRMSQNGDVINRYPVGSGPTSVTTGPGGTVWVAVTGAGKLVWFDAVSPVPSMHDVFTPSTCGPVGLADGGDGRMYFSLPSSDGACNGGVNLLGSIDFTGTGLITTSEAGGGKVFDLAAVNGKLFAPDFDGDVVRRLALGTLGVETSVATSAGAGPDGIASDGAGNLWVTEWTAGKVAAFPGAQNGGFATEFTPVGGTLVNPFGIVAGADGRIYVAGKSSANVARLNPDGTGFAFYGLPDSEPMNIIDGTDGDIWFSDQKKTRILRLVNSAPRAVTLPATPAGPSSASVKASINPRGNDTQVVFDYGPTTAYGKTSAPVNVPSGADPVEIVGVLTGLLPLKTYHVRPRATNAEGAAAGANTTFKTPPYPELNALTSFLYSFQSRTVVKRIDITRLRGGETATIRCSGPRCPFKSKRYAKLKKGKRTFGRTLLRGRRLTAGTTISVRVTAPRTIGTSSVLTVRRNRAPKLKRACLKPNAVRPTPCP